MASRFQGAYTALVTPFSKGRVDDEALAKMVERQVAAGIDGLVPCGTTGESPTLTHAEHVHVVEVVAKAAAGRVPVIAGAGSNCTREAVELARACKEIGVAGTLQITPYYNKPTQAGMVRHFEAIAEASALPIILYNVPGRTGIDLKPETVAELAKNPFIVGIKEATGDMARIRELRAACGDDFVILSGEDWMACDTVVDGGGQGVSSVTANVAPAAMHEMCALALAGDAEGARRVDARLRALHEALFLESNPIPVKWAVAELGLMGRGIRLPLTPLSAPFHDAVRAAMEQADAVAAAA